MHISVHTFAFITKIDWNGSRSECRNAGFRVCVVSDAVSSRNLEDKAISLERLRHYSITVVSTEMLMYELLKKAGTPEFKKSLELVR